MDNEDKLEFFDHLVGHGVGAKEAIDLTEYKMSVSDEVDEFVKMIPIDKSVSLDFLKENANWDNISAKEQDKILWDMGFNTKRYKYVIDVSCMREGGKVKCGKVLLGAERLDKQWLTQVINGHHTASIEARYFNDQDILETMRGNTK